MKIRIPSLVLLVALAAVPSMVPAKDLPPFDNEAELLTELMRMNPAAVPVFQDATDRLEGRQFTAAGRGFLEVVDMAPGFDMASQRAGRCLFRNDTYRRALDLMNQAYELKPRASTAYCLVYYRGQCDQYRNCSITDAEKQGMVALALQASEALPLDPDVKRSTIRTMVKYGDEADIEAAFGMLLEAVEADPSYLELVGAFGHNETRSHIAVSRVFSELEARRESDSFARLVEKVIKFSSKTPEGKELRFWLFEREILQNPGSYDGYTMKNLTELAEATRNPEIDRRCFELLAQMAVHFANDDFWLRSVLGNMLEVARRLQREDLQKVFELAENAPVRGRERTEYLGLQAEVAFALEDRLTLLRIAGELESEHRGTGAWKKAQNLVEKMPASWLYRQIGAALAGIFGAVAFLLGLYWLLKTTISESAFRPSGEIRNAQGGAGEASAAVSPVRQPWSALVACIEAVAATGFVVGFTLLLTWAMTIGPLSSWLPPAVFLGTLLLVSSFYVAGIGILLRFLRCRKRKSQSSRQNRILAGVVFGLVAVGASLVAGIVQSLLGYPPVEQAWMVEIMSRGGAIAIVLALLGIFVTPAAEELLFRGFVFERLRQGWGLTAAYAASSLLFAAIHLSIWGFGYYLLMGLVFCRAYHHRGSMLTAFVAHAVTNTFVFLMHIYL